MILLTVCGVMVMGLRTAHERVVLYLQSLNSLHRSNLQHISEFKRTSYDEIQYSDLTIGEQRLFTVLSVILALIASLSVQRDLCSK